RYASDHPNDYEPKLFDLVFVTKRADTSIGNHLQTHWSGPYTIVQLQGSSMVKAIQGILLEGIGGVEAGEDETTAVVPLIYGASESFSLKNVTHAAALQEVVLNYYQRSQRAYLDSDGTLRTMKLTTTSQPDDALRVARARDATALQHMRQPSPSALRSGDETSRDSATEAVASESSAQLQAEEELHDRQEEGQPDSPTIWATPSPGATDGQSQQGDELSTTSHPAVSTKLRDYFGSSRRPLFGKFMEVIPSLGSVVISTTSPHIGLASVIDDAVGDDYIRLQALDVVVENGMVTTPQLTSIDDYVALYDTVIYVRPSASTWTRTRGRQLQELMTKIQELLQDD
ncbi:hypothetical protein FOZ63_009852, partial [Perkinsus olseni]